MGCSTIEEEEEEEEEEEQGEGGGEGAGGEGEGEYKFENCPMLIKWGKNEIQKFLPGTNLKIKKQDIGELQYDTIIHGCANHATEGKCFCPPSTVVT